MKRKLTVPQARRILLRIVLLLLAAGLLEWGYEASSERLPLLCLSPNTVLQVFATDFQPEAAAGRQLEKIAFQCEFSGTEGETFYVVWRKEQALTETEKYRIVADAAAPGGYSFRPETVFEGLALPTAQFDVYIRTEQGWQLCAENAQTFTQEVLQGEN